MAFFAFVNEFNRFIKKNVDRYCKRVYNYVNLIKAKRSMQENGNKPAEGVTLSGPKDCIQIALRRSPLF